LGDIPHSSPKSISRFGFTTGKQLKKNDLSVPVNVRHLASDVLPPE
jgi:hypothetical protein